MNTRAEGAAVTDRTEPAEFASIAAETLPDALLLVEAFGQADDEQDWQERALCAQTDPEAFFPEKGGSTREAKRICTGCEVRAECLEFALAHDERFGIWGGLSERERRRLKRRAG
jgi:WhiB family transcriptional regulator, redox-sensing transcriptional regulator